MDNVNAFDQSNVQEDIQKRLCAVVQIYISVL